MSVSLGTRIINLLHLVRYLSNRKTIKISRDVVPENWHEEFITNLASVLRPRLYVELGLYHCELFNRIIPFAERLIGVDITAESGKYMEKTDKATFYCKSTQEVAKILKKNKSKIDLLFIDADHSYQSVKADFLAFLPLMSDQGIILLHDAYPKNEKYTETGYCGDGYRAIWELSNINKEYELTTIPVHPGLAICRKRKKQLGWQ